MTKYTQKQLRAMIRDGLATDITNGTIETRKEIEEKEGYYTQVGYSAGVYGCNGMLFKGHNTGALYAIVGSTSAIFVF